MEITSRPSASKTLGADGCTKNQPQNKRSTFNGLIWKLNHCSQVPDNARSSSPRITTVRSVQRGSLSSAYIVVLRFVVLELRFTTQRDAKENQCLSQWKLKNTRIFIIFFCLSCFDCSLSICFYFSKFNFKSYFLSSVYENVITYFTPQNFFQFGELFFGLFVVVLFSWKFCSSFYHLQSGLVNKLSTINLWRARAMYTPYKVATKFYFCLLNMYRLSCSIVSKVRTVWSCLLSVANGLKDR